eukprot:2925630-Rhodomonas_salina.1
MKWAMTLHVICPIMLNDKEKVPDVTCVLGCLMFFPTITAPTTAGTSTRTTQACSTFRSSTGHSTTRRMNGATSTDPS